MRPLLGALAASLLMLATGGARAADSAPAPATPPARVQTQAEINPNVLAARLAPDWVLKATLYHTGNPGVGLKDSIGCRPIAMRTVATDPRLIPRRTVLFIAETVGMRLPGGGVHDGFWYASDVGGAIKGNRIDLYTGTSRASMAPAMGLSLKPLRVMKAGTFRGCPQPEANRTDLLLEIARRSGLLSSQISFAQFIADQWRLRHTDIIAP